MRATGSLTERRKVPGCSEGGRKHERRDGARQQRAEMEKVTATNTAQAVTTFKAPSLWSRAIHTVTFPNTAAGGASGSTLRQVAYSLVQDLQGARPGSGLGCTCLYAPRACSCCSLCPSPRCGPDSGDSSSYQKGSCKHLWVPFS